MLKREDLCHTGSHKINNTLGQCLLARRMGKRRVIAETGAGQHGVATATTAALLGLECDVFMGEEDMARQSLNVFRMELLGARVIPVTAGSRTLKDAVNEALRDWVATSDHTYYCMGSVVGPHPFPAMVRDLQSVIGREAREQHLERVGRLPDCLVACVGGGSNSMGLFLRYVFRWGIAWLDEFQWYLYAAILMVAISYGVVHEAHIRMDLLWSRLGPRARAWIEIGGILLLLLPIVLVVTHHGWSFFVDSWRVNERSPAPTGMPWRWAVKVFIPIGGLLLGLAAVSRGIAQAAFLVAGRGHGAQ